MDPLTAAPVTTGPQFLVTHSGGFHADDLLCTVVLSRLFPAARVIRSRSAEWVTPFSDRIIFDVGRLFDPARGIFDHHQKDAPLRPDGQPFSAFGLIWRQFGGAYLGALGIPQADIEAIQDKFDRAFVLPVDLLDNGALDPGTAGALSELTLPVLLEAMKPAFDTRNEQADDAAFAKALAVARPLVEAVIGQMAAEARAEQIVLHAIAEAGPSPVLELPMGMPYRAAIERAGADHLLFVIHPRDGDWALNGIRISEDSFVQRADLPVAWAGLTDAALEQASGVKGARFCHNARFIAVADSRQAVLRMAEKAVAEATATAVKG